VSENNALISFYSLYSPSVRLRELAMGRYSANLGWFSGVRVLEQRGAGYSCNGGRTLNSFFSNVIGQ